VRELDVLLELIGELMRNDESSSAALTRLAAAVESERAVARERLAARLSPEKLKRIAAALHRATEHLESNVRKTRGRIVSGPRRPWLSAMGARVARRATDLRSSIEAAGTVYAPERLHDVRIALKKLRYATEVLAETRGQRTTPAIGALRSAQDLLGRLQDRHVLIERAQSLEASAPLPVRPADDDLRALAWGLETECRRLHAQYMRDRAMLIVIADRLSGVPPVATSMRRRVAS
jgi:CHAD domain-containing protein